jgi:hypothetical protein
VTTLRIETMGALGTTTQAVGGDLQSSLLGKVGTLKSTGSLTDVRIRVSGGIFDLDGQIGNLDIGGDLIGGADIRSGAIYATGCDRHCARRRRPGRRSLVTESGSIITERTLNSYHGRRGSHWQ